MAKAKIVKEIVEGVASSLSGKAAKGVSKRVKTPSQVKPKVKRLNPSPSKKAEISGGAEIAKPKSGQQQASKAPAKNVSRKPVTPAQVAERLEAKGKTTGYLRGKESFPQSKPKAKPEPKGVKEGEYRPTITPMKSKPTTPLPTKVMGSHPGLKRKVAAAAVVGGAGIGIAKQEKERREAILSEGKPTIENQAASGQLDTKGKEAETPQTSVKVSPQQIEKDTVSFVETKGGSYPVFKKDSSSASLWREAYATAKESGDNVFEFNGLKYKV